MGRLVGGGGSRQWAERSAPPLLCRCHTSAEPARCIAAGLQLVRPLVDLFSAALQLERTRASALQLWCMHSDRTVLSRAIGILCCVGCCSSFSLAGACVRACVRVCVCVCVCV